MKETYQVLLVDDEPIILRSLKVAVPWADLNMEVAGEARNGKEALELAEAIRPDIIVSDIRMPVLDGVGLIKQLAPDRPELIFIILSGYGEFEYAREALRYGAFDYMLKPIDHEELIRSLTAARQKLEETLAEQSEVEYLRRSAQSLSSLVRERMLFTMIEGTEQPFQSPVWMDQWEIESGYYMLVVRLDNLARANRLWDWKEKQLWFFAILNILKEYGEQTGCWTVFPFHGGEWVVIYEDSDEGEIKQKAGEMVSLIKKYTGLSCSVGLSRRCDGIGQLHAGYYSAKRALKQRYVSQSEGMFLDTGPSGKSCQYPHDIEREMIEAVGTLDHSGLKDGMNKLHRLVEESGCDHRQGERIFMEMLTALQRQFEQRYPRHLFKLDASLEELSASVSAADMAEIAWQALEQWLEECRKQGREDGTRSIDRAIEYIESRYHHDLGVDEVAEYCGLSSSHFCVLFRQVVGQTFLEYLTRYRIEKACSILRNSDVKVYQVAPLVGYIDSRYFTQVFKKVVGLTPTEYRQSI